MMGLLRKIDWTPGGLLLFSLLYFYLDLSMFVAWVGNIIIHEFGHIFALWRCGLYVRKITVGLTGLCIACNMEHLSRRAVIFCNASGPMLGLCAAIAASFLGNLLSAEFLLLFAGTGLILSLFNLLPIKPLDGWRILYAVAPKYALYISCICSVVVLLLGLYVMYSGYGTALAFLGIFFLAQR